MKLKMKQETVLALLVIIVKKVLLNLKAVPLDFIVEKLG